MDRLANVITIVSMTISVGYSRSTMYGIPGDLVIAMLHPREKTFLMIWYRRKLEINTKI